MIRLRNRVFLITDAILLSLTTITGYLIRYEGATWGPATSATIPRFLAVSIPLKILIFFAFGLYGRLWRYAGISDLGVIVRTTVTSGVIIGLVGAVLFPLLGLSPERVPISVLVLDAGFTVLIIVATRLMPRYRAHGVRQHGAKPAVIVGAGAAGGMIVRELTENPQLGIRPVAFVDDDPSKQGMRLNGVPVLGQLSALGDVAKQVSADDVVVAIPSASGTVVRDVIRRASEAGLKTRTVPGLYEILTGKKLVSTLRNVEIHDLLRRAPIVTDEAQVRALVTGETVLVTGAGGSIGSELCRQLARLEPSRIVVVGRGENSIFELLQEMHRKAPGVRIDPVIADVRDERRMQQVFATHRPHAVFHAAAHKHVPLMEANVSEAVLNNILGTSNVVHCSAMCEAEHFVLISSDKAVRPTSVMGATKRIAEYVVHEMTEDHPCYVAVRFGNVLGSRGSVVPTFMRQIAAGGPVTITHPDMTRYFMTIPEAVQLVLQASALGDAGEIFVLDMGEPVRVLDLALDMLRLSDLEVGSDIELEFTGMRPGEKLYEELFFGESVAEPTIHPKILRARDATFPENGHEMIDRLLTAARQGTTGAKLRRLIADLVPEYRGVIDTGEFHIPGFRGSATPRKSDPRHSASFAQVP